MLMKGFVVAMFLVMVLVLGCVSTEELVPTVAPVHTPTSTPVLVSPACLSGVALLQHPTSEYSFMASAGDEVNWEVCFSLSEDGTSIEATFADRIIGNGYEGRIKLLEDKLVDMQDDRDRWRDCAEEGICPGGLRK